MSGDTEEYLPAYVAKEDAPYYIGANATRSGNWANQRAHKLPARVFYVLSCEEWSCGFIDGCSVSEWHWAPHAGHASYRRETLEYIATQYFSDSKKYRNVQIIEVSAPEQESAR